VEANDKRFARVKVLEQMCTALEHALAAHEDGKPDGLSASNAPHGEGTRDGDGDGKSLKHAGNGKNGKSKAAPNGKKAADKDAA
jgi:hypothetical protein